jgi:hypothetical protein
MTKEILPLWQLYWAPEGLPIARVRARNESAARRRAPQPYRKYLGEIGVDRVEAADADGC